jgi:hypothetical protein
LSSDKKERMMKLVGVNTTQNGNINVKEKII